MGRAASLESHLNTLAGRKSLATTRAIDVNLPAAFERLKRFPPKMPFVERSFVAHDEVIDPFDRCPT